METGTCSPASASSFHDTWHKAFHQTWITASNLIISNILLSMPLGGFLFCQLCLSQRWAGEWCAERCPCHGCVLSQSLYTLARFLDPEIRLSLHGEFTLCGPAEHAIYSNLDPQLRGRFNMRTGSSV